MNSATQFILSTLVLVGDFSLFIGRAFASLKRLWFRRSLFIKHCEFIGVSSAGVVFVAAFFVGAVLGYQLYVSFHIFGAEALLGGTIGLGLFRELGPVMTSIMVTGRAGAAIAAEISSMKITEQVDALEVMAVNPIEYLVTPRIMAGFVMMPLLGVFFCGVASIAGGLIACGVMELSWATYWEQFEKMVDAGDVHHCIIKSASFGIVLTVVACFCGMRAQGGASAVGFATKTTVVASFLLILLVDYILTSILPFGFAWLEL